MADTECIGEELRDMVNECTIRAIGIPGEAEQAFSANDCHFRGRRAPNLLSHHAGAGTASLAAAIRDRVLSYAALLCRAP